MKHLSFDVLLVTPIPLHATAPDPGGPCIVWSSVNSCLLTWTGTEWGSMVFDPELKTLENMNTYGFVVRDSNTGSFVTRQLIGKTDQISIDYGTGTINPTISLTNTGVAPGIYTKVEVDATGRILSAGSLTTADIPSDYLNLYRENFVGSVPYPSATGDNAIALGHTSQATAPNSVAIGEHSITRHKGAIVHAAGRFQMSGDCQVGNYIVRTVTTNNFFKQMYLDGPMGTSALVLPDDCTWTFTATITAHRTDGYDGHAGFCVKGVVYRGAGANTIQIQGAPIVEIISRSNISWTINTAVDASTGALVFSVKGETNKIIRWMGSIQTVEITN